ncbi:unnamed protein product [Schistocephalus solidus]|uniref:PABC domain-containing protein n=1 Tax=Schistocephalus solidus TaxID=70667 RepID=A0A183T1W6_SCHSO|nr:unnamed protein product [Schistocephalus solidus]
MVTASQLIDGKLAQHLPQSLLTLLGPLEKLSLVKLGTVADKAIQLVCASYKPPVLAGVTSPVPSQSQEEWRQERAQVARVIGAASGRTTTPGSDPTEWECRKGYIEKELL